MEINQLILCSDAESVLDLRAGTDDKIVPPNQAELMYAAVKEKGLPVSYLLYEGIGDHHRYGAACG